MNSLKYTFGRFYAVGMGPGNPDLLTMRAAEVLRSADCIFYVEGENSRTSISRLIATALGKDVEKKLRKLSFSMAPVMSDRQKAWKMNAEKICTSLNRGVSCAFATIGDPLLYSTFLYIKPYIKKRFPDLKIEIVPGITSFQAAAATAEMPLAMNDEILTVIPAWKMEYADRYCVQESDSLVFMKTYKTRASVVDMIRKNGREDFLYASRVGLEDELIISDSGNVADIPEEYLSLIISRKSQFLINDIE